MRTLNNTFLPFMDAYRMEELGFKSSNTVACYWTCPMVANESPKFSYIHDVIYNLPDECNSLAELTLTVAPSIAETLDFLRTKFNIYVHIYPLTTVIKNDSSDTDNTKVACYKQSGKFGYTVNRFNENGELIEMYANLTDAAFDDFIDAGLYISSLIIEAEYNKLADI